MTQYYPFRSWSRRAYRKLREGRDFVVWRQEGFDIDQLVTAVQGPIIEIGGPTESGYYFLDKAALPREPLITNISKHPFPYADNAPKLAALVQEVVDGRKLPYADGSVGMFLMAGMSVTSDWYMELSEEERQRRGAELKEQLDKEFDVAQLEMEQVALGVLGPEEVKYAQRVRIYLEMRRCLAPGGVLCTDGGVAELKILQQMGFKLVAFTQEHVRPERGGPVMYHEFVMVTS